MMKDYGSSPADHSPTPAGYRTQLAEIGARELLAIGQMVDDAQYRATSRELAKALAEQLAQQELMRLQAEQQQANPRSAMSLTERIKRIESILGIAGE